MLDGKQLKTLGLRFARALHMTIKTAVMFTVEDKSVERPIQQSFQLLNHLLKEAGQFTFGFVDNQVMLNNLLTTDTSLRHLEIEFLKRGVAAVTFEPGLTLGRYKKVVGLLSVPSKVIDDAGGILVFLDQNEIEGARILPAAKNQNKDEHGDTIIETDSEAYILSKQMGEEQAPRDLMDSIDALLESAWLDPSTRAEVLSDFAPRGMDGSGYGVPVETPNLSILKPGEVVTSAPAGPDGAPVDTQPVTGGSTISGQGNETARTGGAGGVFGGNAGGSGGPFGSTWIGTGAPTNLGSAAGGVGPLVSGQASTGSGGMPGLGNAAGRSQGGPWTSGSGSFMDLVEASVKLPEPEVQGPPWLRPAALPSRSEEHTSELQSHLNLV